MKRLLSKNLLIPLAAYAAVIAAIIISRTAISPEYALLLSAGFMLWVPFLIDRGAADVLRFDPRRFLQGAGSLYCRAFLLLSLPLSFFRLFGKDG